MLHAINSFSGAQFLRQPAFGVPVALLLLGLLIVEALFHTFDSRRTVRLSSYTVFAAIPLMALFVLVLITRFSFAMGK